MICFEMAIIVFLILFWYFWKKSLWKSKQYSRFYDIYNYDILEPNGDQDMAPNVTWFIWPTFSGPHDVYPWLRNTQSKVMVAKFGLEGMQHNYGNTMQSNVKVDLYIVLTQFFFEPIMWHFHFTRLVGSWACWVFFLRSVLITTLTFKNSTNFEVTFGYVNKNWTFVTSNGRQLK